MQLHISSTVPSRRSHLVSLILQCTILFILSTIIYSSSIIPNNNNIDLIYSPLEKDSLLNSKELENSIEEQIQLYNDDIIINNNAGELINDNDQLLHESNKQIQQQDVNFNSNRLNEIDNTNNINNDDDNGDQQQQQQQLHGQYEYSGTTSSSISSSNSQAKLRMGAFSAVGNKPSSQGAGECEIVEHCRKCTSEEKKIDPLCAKTGYKKVINCNNQLTSYACTDSSRLTSNILFFEVGILTVLLIALYFVKERKRFMMQQHNDRLARQLNKI